MGQCVKEMGVGGRWHGGVNDGEGDCTVVVDKDFKTNREARVSFSQARGSQVGPVDSDWIAFGMGSRTVPGGVEPPDGTGKGRTALR